MRTEAIQSMSTKDLTELRSSISLAMDVLQTVNGGIFPCGTDDVVRLETARRQISHELAERETKTVCRKLKRMSTKKANEE